MMNVFAGEGIVESYLMGAVGYVNPYGKYNPAPRTGSATSSPRADWRMRNGSRP